MSAKISRCRDDVGRYHSLDTAVVYETPFRVKRSRRSGSEDICMQEDFIEMSSMEKSLCIKCNQSGKLLVCYDRSCPIAVHEKCMNPSARFDETTNFYCPYCSYKRTLEETCRARQKALSAKQALSIFLDKERTTNRQGISPSIIGGGNGFDYQSADLGGDQEVASVTSKRKVSRGRADEHLGNNLCKVSAPICADNKVRDSDKATSDLHKTTVGKKLQAEDEEKIDENVHEKVFKDGEVYFTTNENLKNGESVEKEEVQPVLSNVGKKRTAVDQGKIDENAHEKVIKDGELNFTTNGNMENGEGAEMEEVQPVLNKVGKKRKAADQGKINENVPEKVLKDGKVNSTSNENVENGERIEKEEVQPVQTKEGEKRQAEDQGEIDENVPEKVLKDSKVNFTSNVNVETGERIEKEEVQAVLNKVGKKRKAGDRGEIDENVHEKALIDGEVNFTSNENVENGEHTKKEEVQTVLNKVGEKCQAEDQGDINEYVHEKVLKDGEAYFSPEEKLENEEDVEEEKVQDQGDINGNVHEKVLKDGEVGCSTEERQGKGEGIEEEEVWPVLNIPINTHAEATDSFFEDNDLSQKNPEASDEDRMPNTNVDVPLGKSAKSASKRTSAAKIEKNITNDTVTKLEKSLRRRANTPDLNSRRKPLPWRDEEEEMLKKGIQEYAIPANKNMPWRKVLEFGRHVFDLTRTPADLKDKWRRYTTKESS